MLAQDDLAALRAFNEDLHPAVAHNEQISPAVAVLKHGFALFEVTGIHHVGQGITLFIVQQRKNRHFANHGYISRHWFLPRGIIGASV